MTEYHAPVNTPASGPGRGGSAKGYKWEQFAEGNVVRMTHGATHPGTVEPLARALTLSLAESAPWCAAPAFATAVRSWSWSEAQAALLRTWLDVHGTLDENGEVRPAAHLLGRVESRLIKLRSDLGLTPQSLAQLLTRAASVAHATGDSRMLEALEREGRRILESRAGE